MSKFKRVISGLVGVAIAASMFTSMPFSVFAEDKTETNNQTYVYDDYEVSYQVTNSWGDTEVVSVTLSNTGDNTIEDWMLYFDPNGEVQYTIDCQQLTTSDGISYFKNSGYNADVAPDSSVTFGYAVNDCEAVPESFTLCQKRETKTDGYTVVATTTSTDTATETTTTTSDVKSTDSTEMPMETTTTFEGWYESQYEITIDNLPSKTAYHVGDELDLLDLKVSLVLYDQHGCVHTVYTAVSPLDYSNVFVVDTSNFDNSKVGMYTLKISCTDEYQSFLPTETVAFAVDVTDNAVVTTETTALSSDTTAETSSTTTTTTTTIVTTNETETTASTETTATTETTSTTTTTTDDTTLPQTGYSKWYHVVVILAACMTGTGAVMVIGSGALKRKQK